MKERRLEQDSGKAEIPGRRRPLEGVILEQRLALREERAGRAESQSLGGNFPGREEKDRGLWWESSVRGGHVRS